MEGAVSDDDDPEMAADAEALVTCPYCGEATSLTLDPSGGTLQEYVEDCAVCCQPWRVRVRWRRNGRALVEVGTTDE
jgi:hypothetical protein